MPPSLEKSKWQKREEGGGLYLGRVGRTSYRTPESMGEGPLSAQRTLCLFQKPTLSVTLCHGGQVGAGHLWSDPGGKSLPPLLPLGVEKSQGISPAEEGRSLGSPGKEGVAQKG